MSGSAHWDGGFWVISVNGTEYTLRQRFSVMHEFKHILDHPVRSFIVGEGKLTADDVAEKVADYFSACVLMPKAWVKSAYCTKTQSVEELAELFGVSQKAMSYRLSQLGLTVQVDRCRPAIPARLVGPARTYFRSPPLPAGALR